MKKWKHFTKNTVATPFSCRPGVDSDRQGMKSHVLRRDHSSLFMSTGIDSIVSSFISFKYLVPLGFIGVNKLLLNVLQSQLSKQLFCGQVVMEWTSSMDKCTACRLRQGCRTGRPNPFINIFVTFTSAALMQYCSRWTLIDDLSRFFSCMLEI